MIRTGVSAYLATEFEEFFSHPHNAYLETIFDNGIIGLLIVVPFYFLFLKRSFGLFRRQEDDLANAIGGIGCSLLLALLIGSLGGQTFYPREGSVAMWAALGIVVRVSLDRRHKTAEELEVVEHIPASAGFAARA